MPNSALSRNYSMPVPDLIQYSFNLVGYLTRDAIPMGIYGVTAPDITSLMTLTTQLSNFPTDEEFIGDVGIATEDKNAKAEELYSTVKSIIIRAENKWGVNSFRYKKFGITGLYKMNDRDLYVCAKRVHHVATGFLTDLASEGLTSEILDSLLDLADEFESKMFDVNEAIAVRDKNTEDRIELANNLYAYVVKYTNFGKTIWENTSEAYYNDYLIYPGSTPGSLTPPTGIHFVLANMSIIWDNSENAVSYSIEISQDGLVFNEIFNGTANSFIYVPTFDGIFKIRARSHNASGYSDYSDTYTFAYFATLPTVSDLTISLVGGSASMFQLSWSAIPSVTVYKVYKSEVAIGNPAGEYVYVADTAGTVYSGTAVTGKRSWYILKCANETQMSVWGNAVYLDVAAGPV